MMLTSVFPEALCFKINTIFQVSKLKFRKILIYSKYFLKKKNLLNNSEVPHYFFPLVLVSIFFILTGLDGLLCEMIQIIILKPYRKYYMCLLPTLTPFMPLSLPGHMIQMSGPLTKKLNLP